ncbi:MAG: hypothetical protein IH623_16110 [Verrucomicrobia bacterium]|nr:hypothetical protein [Verrucomicrobiota bacterium]
MNKTQINPDDARLSALLHESRAAPALPPRFQEGVWRRIERAEAQSSANGNSWLDALIQMVFRPRLAFAAVAALVLAGALLGVREGVNTARHDAQARYLATVAPSLLR